MRKLISTENIPKDDWLVARKKGIGGSDIAGICGLSSYASPLSIYLDKTDQASRDDKENIAMELGLELEPFLSKKFTKWMGEKEGLDIELKKMPWILQHDTIDYFLVNLDRWFEHPQKGSCPVELKTTTEFKREQWRDDEVPDEYYLQCQWQLLITGWKFCYLAFLIGNRTFDVKVIPRNEKVIENLKNKATTYWEENIIKNQPPAPIGLASDTEALKILYPEEYADSVMELTDKEEGEIVDMVAIIEEQDAIEKAAKKEKTKAQQIIKAKIADKEYMVAGGRKITYKTIIVPEHMVKKFQYRKLHID